MRRIHAVRPLQLLLIRTKNAFFFLLWFLPCLWLVRFVYLRFPNCDEFWQFIDKLARTY